MRPLALGGAAIVTPKFISRWLDIPPIWLLGHIVVVVWFVSVDWVFAHEVIACVFWGVAAVLIAAAAFEFFQFKTTAHPHNKPRFLIKTGVFRQSRNPIYLADLLVLLGVVIWFKALFALPVLVVFFWIVQTRFIACEEQRLSRLFPDDWRDYCERVRRWV